ncbi:ClbS/DfsB family four-helix bundle protein [Enterococcus sp. LJL120]
MARPQDKATLIAQSQEYYERLIKLIESLSPAEQAGTFPFDDRDRNLRDVLIHLYEWHQMYLTWVHKNYDEGISAKFLPAPYTMKMTPELNQHFWQQHQETSLETAKKLLAESHQAVMAEFDRFSDEELFTKKYFPWTGTTSLGSYSVSAASSHYDWAWKKIRKYQKTLK